MGIFHLQVHLHWRWGFGSREVEECSVVGVKIQKQTALSDVKRYRYDWNKKGNISPPPLHPCHHYTSMYYWCQLPAGHEFPAFFPILRFNFFFSPNIYPVTDFWPVRAPLIFIDLFTFSQLFHFFFLPTGDVGFGSVNKTSGLKLAGAFCFRVAGRLSRDG